MEVRLVIESFILFLAPAIGSCTGLEASCLVAGVFFSTLYILALGLWLSGGR
jgi:hypothetical protein